MSKRSIKYFLYRLLLKKKTRNVKNEKEYNLVDIYAKLNNKS